MCGLMILRLSSFVVMCYWVQINLLWKNDSIYLTSLPPLVHSIEANVCNLEIDLFYLFALGIDVNLSKLTIQGQLKCFNFRIV